jgi:Animal haem peroxidase
MQQHGGGSASLQWRSHRNWARAEAHIREHSADNLLGQASFELGDAAHLDVPAVRTETATLIPDPAGFQHFLAAPRTLDDCFTLDGMPFDPSDERAWERAAVLMDKLTQLCMVPPVAPTPRENREVPSGYTYLLQLVAHDIVHSSILLSRANDRLFAFANVRDMPLRLHTIYGGGPAQCPQAYRSDANFRHRLRLGKMRKAAPNGGYELLPAQLRDLARGTAGTAIDGDPALYSEPCIADPRNDSHAIISQLVSIFHILHNKIADMIGKSNVGYHPDPIANAERLFIATYVACILIYRAIIRHDMLPKILDPDVRQAYDAGTIKPLNASASSSYWRAPLEFTHGFMRFAHAMIRPHYSFNELTNFPTDPSGSDTKAFQIGAILDQSSQRSADRMPFERKWIVDWSRFFGDSAVNFSIPISPLANPTIEIGIQGVERSKLLLERDLLSSLAVQPLSIRALVRALQQRGNGTLVSKSPLLSLNEGPDGTRVNPPGWYAAISDWLSAQNVRRYLMSADEIKNIALDPPIPFFVRFEAEQEPDNAGKRLGTLGSIIFADVAYGIFQRDPIVGINSLNDLKTQLEQLAAALFKTDQPETVFAFLGEMKTFPDLLAFLGDEISFPRE